MSEENKAVLQRWFEEIWNQGRADVIDELFAADGAAYGLSGESGDTLRGPAAFREFHRNFRGAFPDIVVTVEDLIAEGDQVAARCTVRGLHTGDSLGVAATNQPMEMTGITIARLRDGKIVEAWNNFDFMSMHKQLGTL